MLPTKTPTSIKIYNVLNPDVLYNVSTFAENGTIVSFSYAFNGGKYGVRVWYDVYGWGDSAGYLTVGNSSGYVVGAVDVSYAGSTITINGTDIGP